MVFAKVSEEIEERPMRNRTGPKRSSVRKRCDFPGTRRRRVGFGLLDRWIVGWVMLCAPRAMQKRERRFSCPSARPQLGEAP